MGGAPSGASRQTWFLRSFSLYRGVGGGTLASLRGASPLCPPHVGAQLPHPQRAGAPPRAPGDFLVRRKSPKTHQEPPGSWTSGTRGRTPLDSPAPCPSGIGCGSIEPAESSGASHLPSHGLKTQSVISVELEEKIKTDLPTNPKWQIGLFLWLKPYRGGAGTAGGAGAKSETLFARSPSGDSKGRSPWRAFGDFPRDGKVTRVPSMAKPCSRGAPAGGCRDYQSRKNPRGRRGGAPALWGLRGLEAPTSGSRSQV